MAIPRPLDDLGPDFERRWKQTPRPRRRELIAELRDLYLMLEKKDAVLLSRLGTASTRPSSHAPRPPDATLVESRPAAPAHAQGALFSGDTPYQKENPFLPRNMLERLQESQSRASAGLRELMQTAETAAPLASPGLPDPLERELRLRLERLTDNLIESRIEVLRKELRAEAERLIAEYAGKV